ncbi:MAG: carbon starvation protein A [Verrucomicrobiae bacterium]|nr:carbon starvation protein A [Verrucomicrobiae bacterium]
MSVFTIGLLLLILGYTLYGRLVARAVQPDPTRVTPSFALKDDVDYVPMPTWRVFLIQLLNIAGLGPVFGAIMGALWGPQVFLWIVFGCIFGGAVHDFLSGAMSIRNKGAGLPDLIGQYLGNAARHVATFVILVLMVLVGTVFVKGPALLLVELLPAKQIGAVLGSGATEWLETRYHGLSIWTWIVMGLIYVYYILATLMPIDKIIGRFYPFFALALLIMVLGLGVALLTGHIQSPTLTFKNLHPKQLPSWPLIFITVSCGAVSGFHATQSPLMARCLKNENQMRFVFYGAMIAEGMIALIWASVAQGFYHGTQGLAQALNTSGGAGGVVHTCCVATMGTVGGVLAILGVIVLPITSGDTAFRVARLMLADYFGLPQKPVGNRYKLVLPLFLVSFILNFVNFEVVWRYFGWTNQTLAAVTLWGGTVYLAKRGNWWWLAFVPAVFMTIMTSSYILVEKVGFGLDVHLGTAIGVLIGIAAATAFLIARTRFSQHMNQDQPAIQPNLSQVK